MFLFQLEGTLQLLDGDRIALLLASLVSQLLGSFQGATGFSVSPELQSLWHCRLQADVLGAFAQTQ